MAPEDSQEMMGLKLDANPRVERLARSAREFRWWCVRGRAFSLLLLVSAVDSFSDIQYENCTGILATINDAVCDFDNNIKSCQYDGGDCCPSTCVSTEDDVECTTDTRECIDPEADDYPYAAFETCNGNLRYLNDSICDSANNDFDCEYDGGDCCPSTCGSSVLCPQDTSDCIDPSAEDFNYIEYENCTGYMPEAGNGRCNDDNNNFECGYDWGDCCVCTCEPSDYNCVTGFDCLDPDSEGDEDECAQVKPCSVNMTQWVVEDTAGASELARSINCSGGVFNVEWREHVIVTEIIWVTHLTTLNITGIATEGPATADGDGTTRIFSVVNATLHLENMQLVHGSALSAGALFIDGGNVSFSGEMRFTNHTSTRKGAITVVNGGNISSDGNLTFAYNSCAWIGGAITIEYAYVSLRGNTTFVGNKVDTIGTVDVNNFGGAIYARNHSRLSMSGETIFIDNIVTGDSVSRQVFCYGGAVAAESGSLISLAGRTSFVGNSATSGGGALYANDTASYIWTTDTIFSNNAGDNGGAVLLEGASTASWSGETTFEGNEADIGGVFYIIDGSTVRWTANTTLFGNKATSYGGAVYVRDSCVLESNGPTQFENNTASEGGGLYIGDGPNVALNSPATFAHNVAEFQGGAIYAVSDTITTGDTEIHFNAPIRFFNNHGGTYGGALMVSGSISLEFDSVDIEFKSNKADTTGGAMLLSGVGIAPTFLGSKFIENEAEIGGAVYATGTGTAISATGEISPLTFDKCNFTGNMAASTGGAVESAAGNDYFVNTSFVDNVAITQGGALRLAGTASIVDCRFERNTAAEDGGPAISNVGYIDDMSSCYLADNEFNCDAGYFLHFEMGDRYDIVCSGCDIECYGCTLYDNYTYPICLEELEHTESAGGSVLLETLNISKGYWRAIPTSLNILECYNEDACLGGLTNSTEFCATGYEGPYCAVCSHGYAESLSYTCQNCSDDKAVLVAWLLVPSAAVLVLIFIGYMVSREHHTTNRVCLESFKKLPLQSIKIVIVSWQILTELTSVANISFPSAYEIFLDGADLLNFDVGWVLSAGCLIDMDFHDRLIACTLGPLAAMGALAFTYKIALHRNRGCEDATQKARGKHVSMALWITFLVYSSASSTVFQMFSCETLDDDKRYLRADYSILCYSLKHQILQVYAAFMIMVYPIGIPLAYTALLYVGRDALNISPAADNDTIYRKAATQLSSPYRPGCFYYEVVECIRRVTLTGAIVFVLPHEMGQVAVTLIFVVIFALCSESLAPYRSAWDAWISRTGHVVVFLSIFVAFLVLYVDDDEGGSTNQDVYGSALVATNICWIVAVAIEGVTTACSGSSVVENLPWSKSSSAAVGFSDEDLAAAQAVSVEDLDRAVERPRFRPSKQLPMPMPNYLAHDNRTPCAL